MPRFYHSAKECLRLVRFSPEIALRLRFWREKDVGLGEWALVSKEMCRKKSPKARMRTVVEVLQRDLFLPPCWWAV